MRYLRSLLFSASVLAASSTSVSLAGTPPFYGGPALSQGEVTLEDTTSSSGQNRFGVSGAVSFGAKAKFLSDTFTGTDIEVIAGDDPINVEVLSADASSKESGAAGGEVFYERLFSDPEIRVDGLRKNWGIRIAAGYQQLSFADTGFAETFNSDSPGLSLGFGAMDHDLEADMYYLNIGLFSESYLTDRVYMQLSGGLSAAYLDGAYTVTGPYNFATENGSDTDIVFGGYLSATLGYDITSSLSFFTGIRYTYLSTFEMGTQFSNADVEFNHAYTGYAGLRFRF